MQFNRVEEAAVHHDAAYLKHKYDFRKLQNFITKSKIYLQSNH